MHIGFWATAGAGAGGGGPAYELISSTILSSTATSVTFSSIDTTSYKHLQLRWVAKSDSSATGAQITFNSDTGANYARHYMQGNGTSVSSSSTTGAAFISVIGGVAATTTTSAFGLNVTDILDYANVNKYTTTRSLSGYATSTNAITLQSGLWLNTAAVTNIAIAISAGNFVIGSRFSLYGIKG